MNLLLFSYFFSFFRQRLVAGSNFFFFSHPPLPPTTPTAASSAPLLTLCLEKSAENQKKSLFSDTQINKGPVKKIVTPKVTKEWAKCTMHCREVQCCATA